MFIGRVYADCEADYRARFCVPKLPFVPIAASNATVPSSRRLQRLPRSAAVSVRTVWRSAVCGGGLPDPFHGPKRARRRRQLQSAISATRAWSSLRKCTVRGNHESPGHTEHSSCVLIKCRIFCVIAFFCQTPLKGLGVGPINFRTELVPDTAKDRTLAYLNPPKDSGEISHKM